MESGNGSGNQSDVFCDGERKPEWIWLHFTAINIITVISLGGNVLVITVISQTRSLHTATSVFVVTLSLSDLCTSLTVMLPSGIAIVTRSYQSHQSHFCDFLGFCYIQFRMTSILALTGISVERCTAIQVPLKYATLITRRRTTISVFLIWAIPCLMASLPFVINLDYSFSNTKGLCVTIYRNNLGFALLVLSGGVCIPMLVTLVMYCCIARVAVKQARKGVVVCDENHCQYVPSRKGEFKAVKTLCAVTGVFFLCWLPYTITNLWSLSVDNVINQHWDVTCEMLTFLSAALNPCLYSLLNRTFRHALIRSYQNFNTNTAQCCVRVRDKARNGRTSEASKVKSNTGKTSPEIAKINTQPKELSVVSVNTLENPKMN